MGCQSLAKHRCLCRKDVTASAKTVEKFNTEFPWNTDPAKVLKRAAKRFSEDSSSNQISARHVHSPSISNPKKESTIPPASINNSFLLLPNRPAPAITSNGYNDLYSSDSEEDPVFEKMVDSNPIVNTVNTYFVEPHKLTLVRPTNKVLKKQRKIRGKTRLATIQRSQSDTTAQLGFYQRHITKCPKLSRGPIAI